MKNQITLAVAVAAVMIVLSMVATMPILTNNAFAGGDHHHHH
ncbi:MAG TPA: hypothetical protein VH500_23620 [Nitrososphaeraceae archaeon]